MDHQCRKGITLCVGGLHGLHGHPGLHGRPGPYALDRSAGKSWILDSNSGLWTAAGRDRCMGKTKTPAIRRKQLLKCYADKMDPMDSMDAPDSMDALS